MNEEYIILNDHKQATHSFINGGKSWDEVSDFDNLARIVPYPFIVLDFDTESDAKIMLDIIESEVLCDENNQRDPCVFQERGSMEMFQERATRLWYLFRL